MNTAEWIERHRAGEAEAFTELVKQTQNLALGYAFSQLGDFHRAQDVVQESFLIAHRKLDTLESPEAFMGWLRKIIHFRCMRDFRRNKEVAVTDVIIAEPGEAQSSEEAIQREQEKFVLMGAIRRLPEAQRLVITLYYLEERPQREVAEFLGWPVTKVNNALYEARQTLKRRLSTMAADTFKEQRLSEEFAKNIGEIVRVRGSLVETKLKKAELPRIFDILGTQNADRPEEAPLLVIQRLNDQTFHCISTGEKASNNSKLYRLAGASYAQLLPGEDEIREVIQTFKPSPKKNCVETGIKVLDFFCPLKKGATVGIFGKEGVGRAVLVMELLHRQKQLKGDLNIFFFSTAWNAPGTQDMLEHEPMFAKDLHENIQTLWLIHPRAADPRYAQSVDSLDARLYFSPLKAAQGLWPAFDPLYSSSDALTAEVVGERHVRLAEEARVLLEKGQALMRDPIYLELLALDAREDAQRQLLEFTQARLRELAPQDATTVKRARRLERFFTQPFYVAEDITKKPGCVVSIGETLSGVERILTGEFDNTDEDQLLWRGALDA